MAISRVSVVVSAFLLSGVTACAPDAAESCTTLCTGAGFASGTADVQDNETNCICADGEDDSAIEDADCQSMCEALGFTEHQVFGSTAATASDACQCTSTP